MIFDDVIIQRRTVSPELVQITLFAALIEYIEKLTEHLIIKETALLDAEQGTRLRDPV